MLQTVTDLAMQERMTVSMTELGEVVVAVA